MQSLPMGYFPLGDYRDPLPPGAISKVRTMRDMDEVVIVQEEGQLVEDGTYLDVNSVCHDSRCLGMSIKIVSKCCSQSKQGPEKLAC